jgi:hypothetical protein
VARSPLPVWKGLAARFFPVLCGVEKRLGDYAEVRHVRDLPLAFGIWARESLARVRIFDHPHFIPDEAPRVELILDYTGAALQVAVDRRSIP